LPCVRRGASARCKKFIFKQVKLNFIEKVLAATAKSSNDCPTIRINRILASTPLGDERDAAAAAAAAAAGASDDSQIEGASDAQNTLSGGSSGGSHAVILDDTAHHRLGELGQSAKSSEKLRRRLFDVHTSVGDTIFGQTFRQLKDVCASRLRPAQPRGTSPHVALNVVFVGEQVLGQAGPYRAFFSDICRELQEPKSPEDPYPLNLFIPTPNNLHRLGEDRDRYMPHPSNVSVQHLELYEFVGRLMGMAMRTHIIMALDLARTVWKQLTNEDSTFADLRCLDEALVRNVLNPLIPDTSVALDRKAFARRFGTHMTISLTKSDQSPLLVDVDGDGKLADTMRIGFDDRQVLVSVLVRSRLEETKLQVAAMRRGLCNIIPEQLLSLMTSQELEGRICGTREIDIELLKRHTEYGPDVDRNAPHIRYLWNTLEGFTQQQLRRFVKFAFAQERLPSTDEGFSHPKIRMLIKSSRHSGSGKKNSNQDHALPHADTCFFNVEIPAYSSQEIMRKRLTTVVNMDWGMSGDDIGSEQSLQSVLTGTGMQPTSSNRTSSRGTRTSSAQTGSSASMPSLGVGRPSRTGSG